MPATLTEFRRFELVPTPRRPTEPPLPATMARVRFWLGLAAVMLPLKSTPPAWLSNVALPPRTAPELYVCAPAVLMEVPAALERVTTPFMDIAPRRVVAPTLLAKVMPPLPALMVRSSAPAVVPLTVPLKATAPLLVLMFVSRSRTTFLPQVCAPVWMLLAALRVAVPVPLTFRAPMRLVLPTLLKATAPAPLLMARLLPVPLVALLSEPPKVTALSAVVMAAAPLSVTFCE